MAKLFMAVCNISCVCLLVIGCVYAGEALSMPDDPDWLALKLTEALHPKIR